MTTAPPRVRQHAVSARPASAQRAAYVPSGEVIAQRDSSRAASNRQTMIAAANTLFALTLLACLFAAGWWLLHRPAFDFRTVQVEAIDGKELKHVNNLTLRSALGRVKGNFFTVDLDSARTAFETVPWVSRAAVRREWPNRLVVLLEEHEALGTWGEEGRLISSKGEVFTANLAEADEDRVLPQLAGPEGSEHDVMQRFAQFRQWFAPLKLTPDAVVLSSRYAWTVKLNNGVSVALGREQSADMLRSRVERLIRVYPQLSKRLRSIDTIDMRYPSGLSLSSKDLVLPIEGKRPIALVSAKAVKTRSKTAGRSL
jgi:cell division protein FtsQ